MISSAEAEKMEDDRIREPMKRVKEELSKLDSLNEVAPEAQMALQQQQIEQWTKLRSLLVDNKLTCDELSDERKILVYGYNTISARDAELQRLREEKTIAESLNTHYLKRLNDQERVICNVMDSCRSIREDLCQFSKKQENNNELLKTYVKSLGKSSQLLGGCFEKDKGPAKVAAISTLKQKRDISEENPMAEENHRDLKQPKIPQAKQPKRSK
jgi:hypothetical protein